MRDAVVYPMTGAIVLAGVLLIGRCADAMDASTLKFHRDRCQRALSFARTSRDTVLMLSSSEWSYCTEPRYQ